MNDFINKYITKLKSPKLLVAVGLVGILLIYLSTFIGSGSDKSDKNTSKTSECYSAEDYRLQLQQSVCEMVKDITGDKKVTVVITLESGIKYSYADVNEGTSANKTESDSESSSSESKQTYITVKTADGGEQALLEKTLMPEIRGVAIVCEGGDNKQLCEKIQSAVMAALNITSKRVYIAGGNSNEKR